MILAALVGLVFQGSLMQKLWAKRLSFLTDTERGGPTHQGAWYIRGSDSEWDTNKSTTQKGIPN